MHSIIRGANEKMVRQPHIQRRLSSEPQKIVHRPIYIDKLKAELNNLKSIECGSG